MSKEGVDKLEVSQEDLKQTIKEAIQESEIKQEKATLTIKEAVDFTGIGRDKLMELAHSNSDFPAFKVGSKFLINKALLEKWLERISIEKRVI